MKTVKPKHNLAVLRKRLGLGQKEMATLARCSQSMIQSIELRRTKLPTAIAIQISIMTNVDVDWLNASRVSATPVDIRGRQLTSATYRNWQKIISDQTVFEAPSELLKDAVSEHLKVASARGQLGHASVDLLLAIRHLTRQLDIKSRSALSAKHVRSADTQTAPVPQSNRDSSPSASSPELSDQLRSDVNWHELKHLHLSSHAE